MMDELSLARRILAYLIVFLGAIWTVLPLYWLFITAFKPLVEVQTWPAIPGLIAVALFVLVFTWNELLFATILTGNDVVPFTRIVPGLYLGRKYLIELNWPAVAALGVLNVIGVIVLNSYLQKHIVRAMTYGAVVVE